MTDSMTQQIVDFCKTPKTAQEICEALNTTRWMVYQCTKRSRLRKIGADQSQIKYVANTQLDTTRKFKETRKPRTVQSVDTAILQVSSIFHYAQRLARR